MAWIWDSWEEYVENVHPVGIQRGTFRLSHQNTQLESARHRLESFDKLTDALNALRKLGFKGGDILPPKDEATMQQAHNHVIEAVYAGEELLVYHKRLALSEASYGFLHQHDILDHWERYAGRRLPNEIQQLTKDIRELIDGYERMAREDERLLLDGMGLPESLEDDFRVARNLFSVGFDEIGLFIAAGGLEKVLREIARKRKVLLETKGKIEPASDLDLHDLIETLSRLRWKVKGTPLLTREMKTLLQYMRTVRNSGAHAGREDAGTEDLRKTASLIASTADRLWNAVTTNKARLEPNKVIRNWP